MKKYLPYIAILSLGIAIGVGFALIFLANNDENGNNTVNNDPLQEEFELLAINEKIIFEETEQYSIDIKYPEIEHSNSRVENSFNSYTRNLFNNQSNIFSQNELQNEELIPTDFKNSLIMDYETSFESDELLSFRTSGYLYLGGAHGTSAFVNLTYNLRSGDVLEISDLFITNSDFLTKLSDLSRQTLLENEGLAAQEEWVMQGTAPELKNYELFYLTEDSLVIIFSDYQVGPYAAGPQEVEISYTELEELLSSEITGLLGI